MTFFPFSLLFISSAPVFFFTESFVLSLTSRPHSPISPSLSPLPPHVVPPPPLSPTSLAFSSSSFLYPTLSLTSLASSLSYFNLFYLIFPFPHSPPPSHSVSPTSLASFSSSISLLNLTCLLVLILSNLSVFHLFTPPHGPHLHPYFLFFLLSPSSLSYTSSLSSSSSASILSSLSTSTPFPLYLTLVLLPFLFSLTTSTPIFLLTFSSLLHSPPPYPSTIPLLNLPTLLHSTPPCPFHLPHFPLLHPHYYTSLHSFLLSSSLSPLYLPHVPPHPLYITSQPFSASPLSSSSASGPSQCHPPCLLLLFPTMLSSCTSSLSSSSFMPSHGPLLWPR